MIFGQVESLLDDQDFKTKVTREEYEGLCKDLFDRVAKPVQDAIKISEVTWVSSFQYHFSLDFLASH